MLASYPSMDSVLEERAFTLAKLVRGKFVYRYQMPNFITGELEPFEGTKEEAYRRLFDRKDDGYSHATNVFQEVFGGVILKRYEKETSAFAEDVLTGFYVLSEKIKSLGPEIEGARSLADDSSDGFKKMLRELEEISSKLPPSLEENTRQYDRVIYLRHYGREFLNTLVGRYREKMEGHPVRKKFYEDLKHRILIAREMSSFLQGRR
jgi:hypothetical protein